MKIKELSFLLSLLILFISFFLHENYLMFIALALVVSVGILHGANDIVLIQKTNFISKKNKFFAVVAYSLVVLLAIAIFYFIPFYALLSFILFSAYHFGEQHLSKALASQKNKFLHPLLYFSFGLTILSMLFWIKPDITNKVIYDLAEFTVPIQWFAYTFIISISTALSMASMMYAKKQLNLKELRVEFLLLLLYAVIFYFTPLILGFAVYFAFWHSLPSLSDQIGFIYKVNMMKGIKLYLRDAGVYWLVSIIGFIVFLYYFHEAKLFYSFLFAFIAAITFPHVIVMGKMFTYLKDKS